MQISLNSLLSGLTTVMGTGNKSNNTTGGDMDWIAVALVALAISWMYSQTYQPGTGSLSQRGAPLVRAALAVVRRLATDLARYVLTILAITAELLLEGKNTSSAILHRVGREVNRVIDTARPAASKAWVCYDSMFHSHHVNVARQRLRSACAFAGTVICWVIAVSAMLTFFVLPSAKDSTAPASYDIQPYVVPAWVIKARPENRPRDGSSSHYQPECIRVQDGGESRMYAPLQTN